MSDYNEITAIITTEEPAVAATLDDLRYLVFQGKKGDTGDSAYEEAVALGFVGTVVQWLASLKGAPGANGRDGQDGAPGTPGRDGVSPTVQTEAITGGHRVTITDAEHPSGQTFDVMDGDSAIVPAYIDTDVIRYLNDHGTHAADDIYTSLLMREDVDSGVLPFIMRPTGSDSTTEEYFELDHQIHSADSPVIHFRSREHLLAVDNTGHFTMADRPQAKNAVRYDEQMALTDTQKETARSNIDAIGQLEYDALERDIGSLEAGLSLKLDAADAPTKVSDLTNDTGYITASQVPAAPVQSVNGKTGSVTVNEVPAVGSTDSKKVLTADNGTYSWAAVPTGETTKRISLYKNSQTGVYTCSMTATQLHDALPNVVLSTEDYRVPLSAYAIDKTGVYVKAVFIDDRRESNSAIVWTLSAGSSSDLITVSRDEHSIEALPDYSLTTGGEVLKITQYGPRWGENIPGVGASLRLLYDGTFGPDDPELMLMGNLGRNLETGAAICSAIVGGKIGSAALVDVSSSNDVKVYGLYAYDYVNDTVVFARTEGALIRTATLSGSTKTAPVFGTIPLADGSANAVLYTQQSLTDAQKAQARTNVGAGTYSKPSGGIPKTDLASDVQASLGKADSALQQHQSLTGYATQTWVEGKDYQTAQQVQTAIAGVRQLPTVTASDNGKFLRVVNGAWAAQTVPAAESNSFGGGS